jgi:hypothetical protein
MQLQAAWFETASNIGQRVCDFVHEIPFVNELL